ncbi:MAG: hypothetical protein U0451_02060 [Candidatus Saccharimonadales bacterium]
MLTKQLEWGRLASYLEQSTRYIYFDKKDMSGKYKYFTPDQFNAKTRALYEKAWTLYLISILKWCTV